METSTGKKDGDSNENIKGRETKNVFILSLSFTFVFTAYLALQNLQSSLNTVQGLGVISLACVYGPIIISSILSPYIIKMFGIKTTLIVSWSAHLLYNASNFYPTFATLITTSVLLGLASGPMWTSQSVYISTNAYSLADRQNTDVHGVLSKLNGIFFTMYETTQITGNLISSLVLNQGSYNNDELENVTKFCGASDCPAIGRNSTEIAEPEPKIVYILLSVLIVFVLAGLLSTVVFLPTIQKTEWSQTTSTKSSIIACFSTCIEPDILLLLPLIAIMSMEQAVLWTDFTKSFISCPIGVRMVGFIMASYGGSTAVFALFTSRIAKYTGRYLLFAIAAIINMSIFVALYVWRPTSDKMHYQFIIVIFWGLAEGIWQTQSNSLIAVLFPEKTEPAFANYHCWKAASFSLYFVLSTYLCVATKLIIVMTLLTIAAVLYVIVEIRVHSRKKSATYVS